MSHTLGGPVTHITPHNTSGHCQAELQCTETTLQTDWAPTCHVSMCELKEELELVQYVFFSTWKHTQERVVEVVRFYLFQCGKLATHTHISHVDIFYFICSGFEILISASTLIQWWQINSTWGAHTLSAAFTWTDTGIMFLEKHFSLEFQSNS